MAHSVYTLGHMSCCEACWLQTGWSKNNKKGHGSLEQLGPEEEPAVPVPVCGESEVPRVGVQARFLETLGHHPNIMEQSPPKSPSAPPPPLWPEVTSSAQLTPSSLELLTHPPQHCPPVLTHGPQTHSLHSGQKELPKQSDYISPLAVLLSWGTKSSLPISVSGPFVFLAQPSLGPSGRKGPQHLRPLHLRGALPENPFLPCLFITCQGPAELPPTKNACDPPPSPPPSPARSRSCFVSGSLKWAGTPLVPDHGPHAFVEGKNK